MKKYISVIAIVMLIFSMAGCGTTVDAVNDKEIKELEERIEELEAENEALKEKLVEHNNEEKEDEKEPEMQVVKEQETWADDYIISFGDASFLYDIRQFTGVTERDITYGDVRYITIYDTCAMYQYGGYDNLSALRFFTSLEDLSVWGDFSSLDGMENLTNLKTLTIGKCENLKDISALSGLTNLETLRIKGCDKLEDISALAGLKSLKSLTIGSKNWDNYDLRILLGFENLEYLLVDGGSGASTSAAVFIPETGQYEMVEDNSIKEVTLDNLQEWVDTHE